MTTITSDGTEGSTLPPSKRDQQSIPQVVRAHGQNLSDLSRGFGGGRYIGARLVDRGRAEDAITDDAGDTADDSGHAWQWEDRHQVTGGGTQTATLTYVPFPESLFVRWHPGGHGGLPVLNENFTLVDNVVTIPDPGWLAADDVFSFQYEFDPTVIPEPPEPPPPPPPPPDPPLILVPDGEVTLTYYPSWGGHPSLYPPGQWGDDDLGTGATFMSRFGSFVTSSRQVAQVVFPDLPSLVVDPDARVAMWWYQTYNDHAYGLTQWLQHTPLSATKLVPIVGGGLNGLPDPPEGYSGVEMVAPDGHTMAEFLTEWQDDSMTASIVPNWPTTPKPHGVVYSTVIVAELRIAIYYP